LETPAVTTTEIKNEVKDQRPTHLMSAAVGVDGAIVGVQELAAEDLSLGSSEVCIPEPGGERQPAKARLVSERRKRRKRMVRVCL